MSEPVRHLSGGGVRAGDIYAETERRLVEVRELALRLLTSPWTMRRDDGLAILRIVDGDGSGP